MKYLCMVVIFLYSSQSFCFWQYGKTCVNFDNECKDIVLQYGLSCRKVDYYELGESLQDFQDSIKEDADKTYNSWSYTPQCRLDFDCDNPCFKEYYTDHLDLNRVMDDLQCKPFKSGCYTSHNGRESSNAASITFSCIFGVGFLVTVWVCYKKKLNPFKWFVHKYIHRSSNRTIYESSKYTAKPVTPSDRSSSGYSSKSHTGNQYYGKNEYRSSRSDTVIYPKPPSNKLNQQSKIKETKSWVDRNSVIPDEERKIKHFENYKQKPSILI